MLPARIWNEILVFGADGQFQRRFGSKGREPGQFNGDAIALDGAGRVYVCDFFHLQVFTPNGQLVRVMDWDSALGWANAMTFDQQGNLWVVTDKPQVVKLEVGNP